MRKQILYFFFLFVAFNVTGQYKKDSVDLTFTGTKINPYDIEYDSTGKVTFSGYIDTYYGYYTDTVGSGGFVKFPTSAPRNNQFGLNILQFSVKYQSNRLRGVGTLFFGDVAKSAWSPNFNFIQEANAGFRIYKKLWLDAGFFRTHIGLESIQPRENITTSFATTTYFEPYFLSGAKLTWQQSQKWTFQVNVFNGYNSFVEDNSSKAYGVSIAFNPTKYWSHTLNYMVCDESPINANQKHVRQYTNYIAVFKKRKITLGMEANFGSQTNSVLKNTNQTAFMFSGIVALKYRFTDKIGAYGRGELFSDPNEILTGPILNNDHKLIGLDVIGGTIGVEYKPIPNAYLRIESRLLRTKRDELVFYHDGTSRNYRWEGIVSLGVWF